MLNHEALVSSSTQTIQELPDHEQSNPKIHTVDAQTQTDGAATFSFA